MVTNWVYQQTETRLWTTGFFDPDGAWHSDKDFDNSEDAAKRCAWLNGSGKREGNDDNQG